MKQIIIFISMFFLVVNSYALEITSVIRTFDYLNIFTYKQELIGISEVNKFGFGNDIKDDNLRPEIFKIKIKARKFEQGKTLEVIFKYKTQKSNKLQKMKKNILVDKIYNTVNFYFPGNHNKTLGRVELWKIIIKENNEEIASKTSHGNKWRK